MALGSSCFGLLFLGSGSTFGSTSPQPFSLRSSVLEGVCWLVPSVRRGAISVFGCTLAILLTARALRGKHSRDFLLRSRSGRPSEMAINLGDIGPENECLMLQRPVHSSRPVTIISETRPPGASLHAPICSPNCRSRSNSWQKPFG